MKKVIKGGLLWITVFSILIFVCGGESLIEHHLIGAIMWFIINLVFFLSCRCLLSTRDIYELSLLKQLERLINKLNN